MCLRYEHPMCNDISCLPLAHRNLDMHIGRGRVQGVGAEDCLDVQIVYPSHGECLLLLAGQEPHVPNRGLGKELEATGECSDGPFMMRCSEFSVHTRSPFSGKSGWAVASPVNGVMKITYSSTERPTRVSALINNFDFPWGDIVSGDQASRMESERLTVDADGRPVVFQRCGGYAALKRLVETGVIPCAPLLNFSFETWNGATEDDLSAFAHNIASLCALISQQHTGIPVLSFLDSQGRVVTRLIGNPIESQFRASSVFGVHVPHGIQTAFRKGFIEHARMQQARLPWRKLWSYCASIEDAPYLEQKFATLMMALEFFMKNSLLEVPESPSVADIEKMNLNKLIGKCRVTLGWDLPGHYTAKDLHRLLRNAVMHGGEMPLKDNADFRRAFDKWRLFLIRRVLMRLGYDGKVLSPIMGWAGSSPVEDFSEAHNSFEPAPGPDPLAIFEEAIKRNIATESSAQDKDDQ